MEITGRHFAISMFVSLLSHQAHAMNGVWKTTTTIDSEKSRAILSWSFNTTVEVTSITIKKGEDDIETSLLTSIITVSDKYRVMQNQTTGEIKITLTVYNITSADSGVYRCSLDQPDVYKDIHLNTALKPQLNPVISTLMQNVKLVWKYDNQHQRYPANKLTFSRENTTIAEWTINGGFTPEEDHSRRGPLFTKKTIQDGEIDVITLIIRDTNMFDFNKTYYCNLFSAGRNILTSELKLVVEIPEWVDPISNITAVLGEDVTFTWRSKYSLEPDTISIRKIRPKTPKRQESIGTWHSTELDAVGKSNNMVRFNKTSTREGEIIQLTLLKITEDEYDCVYECDIIFEDGQEIVSEIKLLETFIDLPTIKHYNLTTQTNSEPTTEIPNKPGTNTETNTVVIVVCVVVTLLVVVGIVVVVVYKHRKRLCKSVYSTVSGTEDEKHVRFNGNGVIQIYNGDEKHVVIGDEVIL